MTRSGMSACVPNRDDASLMYGIVNAVLKPDTIGTRAHRDIISLRRPHRRDWQRRAGMIELGNVAGTVTTLTAQSRAGVAFRLPFAEWRFI